MNQNQVRAMFKAQWAEAVAANPELANDKPAKSLEFGMLLDSLQRDGQISARQFSNMQMEAPAAQYNYLIGFSTNGVGTTVTEVFPNITAARGWAKRTAAANGATVVDVIFDGRARSKPAKV